jgi:hypothetical protein
VDLEKSAQTEILTAHAAEQKAGLFVDPGDASPGSSAAHD